MKVEDEKMETYTIPNFRAIRKKTFMSYYTVEIRTDSQRLKTGTLTITNDDTFSNKVEICMTQSPTPFCIKITFSCGIDINSANIKLSRKGGYIECRIRKDAKTTIGERLLPWKVMKPNTVSRLQDYPRSDFAIEQLKTDVNCMSYVSESGVKSPDKELSRLTLYFLKTAPMSFGMPVYVLTGMAKKNNPHQTDGNIYLLEHLKVFEGRATMFITWYDTDLAHRLISEGRVEAQEVMAVSARRLYSIEPGEAVHLTEGNELLKNILLLNSCRMEQELPADTRWKTRTFLRARYPFTDWKSMLYMNNPDKDMFEDNARRISAELKDMFLKASEISVKSVPVSNSDTSVKSVPVSFSDTSVKSVPVSTSDTSVKCVTCGVSGNCKKCTGCRRVSYCSKDCQRKNWPQHKTTCRPVAPDMKEGGPGYI